MMVIIVVTTIIWQRGAAWFHLVNEMQINEAIVRNRSILFHVLFINLLFPYIFFSPLLGGMLLWGGGGYVLPMPSRYAPGYGTLPNNGVKEPKASFSYLTHRYSIFRLSRLRSSHCKPDILPLTVNLIYLKKDQVIHREEETSVDFVKDNVDSWSCDNIVREITRKLLGKIEFVVYKERIHTLGFWDDQMEKKSTQSCWKSYTAQTHNKWDYKQCGMEV